MRIFFTPLVAAILALTSPPKPVPAPGRSLTLADRVAAQRAIETVYARHRIWPASNPRTRPNAAQILSDELVRAKVEDYLAKSAALEQLWDRPIEAEQLQGELDRLARNTGDPEMLAELYGALGNDPLVIAECLARPLLADRVLRSSYANDSRLHADVRRQAEQDRAAHKTPATIAAEGGARYEEVTYVPTVGVDGEIGVSPEEWDQLNAFHGRRPVDTISPLRENEDAFIVTAVLEKSTDRLTVASAIWAKRPFHTWWEATAPRFRGWQPSVSGSFAVATPRGCTLDTWRPTDEVPSERSGHTAVWTGTEMIVWGGRYFLPHVMNTGGRYDPVTDTWTMMKVSASTPAARTGHTAIWDGTSMVIWGGRGGPGGTQELRTGGRYDPLTNTWSPTSLDGAPSERTGHRAVWTGQEMLVWGGFGKQVPGSTDPSQSLGAGAIYDPFRDTWRPMNSGPGTPSPRSGHSAVWTGDTMIVWGGMDASGRLNSGGRYDLRSDSWEAVGNTGTVPRTDHAVEWAGDRMIVWGGRSSFTTADERLSAEIYDPSTDTWTDSPPSLCNGFEPLTGVSSVWTGDRFWLSVGGCAASYDPVDNTWEELPGTDLPHRERSSVWTGDEWILWGGWYVNSEVHTNQGHRLRPGDPSWAPTHGSQIARPRSFHAAVWTGSEMIIWGGGSWPTFDPNIWGAKYVPATDSWTGMGGPWVVDALRVPAAVWTGLEMIVWGGHPSLGPSVGGRYDPAADQWSPMAHAPYVPERSPAVWTGREMIVWGSTDAGGRYDPEKDQWKPTSVGEGVPEPRLNHTAVWDGEEMVVWGGNSTVRNSGEAPLNTGGRYSPRTDSWQPTSVGPNVPAARGKHSAVWTGREMIVWGGTTASSTFPYAGIPPFLNSGGRYDPRTDTWLPTDQGLNVPDAASFHRAVWNGREMIVWGSVDGPTPSLTGGRYTPQLDRWRTISTLDAPKPRKGNTAVWTGKEMIIWGGTDDMSGGRYCGR